MIKIIQVRCNGLSKCLNEFTEAELEKYYKPTIMVRGQPKKNLPERLVISCRYCAEGKVIVTRKMIEEM
ncbi:MAG: hypothetical protein MUC94_13580 [bacterium]|jgi:hypothetical protein|nr:hypothetical protein [bacterium]